MLAMYRAHRCLWKTVKVGVQFTVEYRVPLHHHLNWLDTQSYEHKEDRAEIIRLLVRDAMGSDWVPGRDIPSFISTVPPPGADPDLNRSPKEIFLDAIRAFYSPELAGSKLGLDKDTVDEYVEQWPTEIAEAMKLKCLDVEHELDVSPTNAEPAVVALEAELDETERAKAWVENARADGFRSIGVSELDILGNNES